jgi:hypothetical protein
MYLIQQRIISRPSDSTVSEDAWIEFPGLLRLWHWLSDVLITWLDLIQDNMDNLNIILNCFYVRVKGNTAGMVLLQNGGF